MIQYFLSKIIVYFKSFSRINTKFQFINHSLHNLGRLSFFLTFFFILTFTNTNLPLYVPYTRILANRMRKNLQIISIAFDSRIKRSNNASVHSRALCIYSYIPSHYQVIVWPAYSPTVPCPPSITWNHLRFITIPFNCNFILPFPFQPRHPPLHPMVVAFLTAH